jgi:tripartite-type tricarboxylate transporter receptor subunit TctC
LRQLRPILLIIGLAFSAADPAAAQAESFPNHPIRIIIGPSPDIFSRIIAEHLQETWGQPVAVEPRPGAGGKLAVTAVSTAVPDGHTLLFATPTYTLNTAMKVATYDLLQEFGPVSMIGVISYVLVIHSSVPAMSVAELVAYAKQSPGELNCASAGIGTVPHLACEYLNKIAGTNILHVPYRDVNSATMATVGNVTQMFFGVSTSAKSQIDSNTLRGLAVSTAQRSLLLPDLPTMIESGYPTFDMPGWGACLRRRVHPPTLSKSSIGRCGGRLSGPICRSSSSPSGWNRHRRRPPPNSGHSLRTTLPAGRNSSMQSELTSSKEKHLNNRLFGENPDNQNESIDR